MRPVYQTICDFKKGNCFAACIASILELPLEEVPNFCIDPKDWHLNCNKWLEGYDLQLLEFEHILTGQPISKPMVVLLTGPSPRDPDKNHCIVGEIYPEDNVIKTRILHDPHPDQKGLFENKITWVGYFVKGLNRCVN